MIQMHHRLLIVGVAFLVFAGTASAAPEPSVSWSKKDMTTAIRGLGYPRPHAKKLACHGVDVAAGGRYTTFRCVATYSHHRHRRFVAGGVALGGWLCAGRTTATCATLRHGFATTGQVNFDGGLEGAAEMAARGYMQVRYGISSTVDAKACAQVTTRSWACGYYGPASQVVTVTVTLKTARGGYLVSATASG